MIKVNSVKIIALLVCLSAFGFGQFRDSATFAIPTPSGKKVKITQLYLNTDTTASKIAGGIAYKGGYLWFTDGSSWIRLPISTSSGSVGNADSLGGIPAARYAVMDTNRIVDNDQAQYISGLKTVNSLKMYEVGETYTTTLNSTVTANRMNYFPDSSGTFALKQYTTPYLDTNRLGTLDKAQHVTGSKTFNALYLYDVSETYKTTLASPTLTDNRTVSFPDDAGTVMLTKDTAKVAAGLYATVDQSGHTATVGVDTAEVVSQSTTQVIDAPKYHTARQYYTSVDADTSINDYAEEKFASIGHINRDGEAIYIATSHSVDNQDLFVHISNDGKTFNLISTSDLYTITGRVVRDPNLFYHQNKYFVAFTTHSDTTVGVPAVQNYFQIISSLDLITWDSVTSVEIFPTATGHHVWSPRWFTDTDGSIGIFVSAGDSADTQMRIYYTGALNNDLTSWSAADSISGTSLAVNMIDGEPIKIGSTYYLFYKNENTKYVELISSSSKTSGYTNVGTGDWAGWGSQFESPQIVQIDTTNFRIYLNDYINDVIYYSESADTFSTWTTKTLVNMKLSNPAALDVHRQTEFKYFRNALFTALSNGAIWASDGNGTAHLWFGGESFTTADFNAANITDVGTIATSGNATIGGDATIQGGDVTIGRASNLGVDTKIRMYQQDAGANYGEIQYDNSSGAFQFYRNTTLHLDINSLGNMSLGGLSNRTEERLTVKPRTSNTYVQSWLNNVNTRVAYVDTNGNGYFTGKGVFEDSLRIDELGTPITKAAVDSQALEFTSGGIEYRALQSAFGELYHDTTGYTVTLSVEDTFYTVKNFNQTSVKRFVSYTDSSITVHSAGVYEVFFSASVGSSSANTDLNFAIFKNYSRQANISAETKVGTANDITDASGKGLLQLAAGDYIMLRVKRTGAGDATINHATFMLNKIH